MTIQEATKNFDLKKRKHLLYSIVLDILGWASFLLPAIGEVLDLFYAPVYALIIFSIYRVRLGNSALLGGIGGFIEEILPGTDFIPSALILWIYTYSIRGKRHLNQYLDKHVSELPEGEEE